MSQTKPTVSEIEVLARSSVKGMSHVDGFKSAYPKSKAKGNSLEVAAYKAYQNPQIHLRITELQEVAKELANDESIADLAECQESLTDVMRTGRVKDEDGKMRDATGVRGAAAELMKQRGDYDHNENEGVTVILNQDIPGCDD